MKLTKTEEEIMQIIWEIAPCMVTEMIEHIGDPDIPHSTISSTVRALERKGYVGHKAYGRTHVYYPVVKREEYSKSRLDKLVEDYFGGSATRLVSFLIREKEVDVDGLHKILDTLDENE